MNKIINLTQHICTEEQKAQGVFEPKPEDKEVIKKLLTFNEIPSAEEIHKSAAFLTKFAKTYEVKEAMIGGASYLMSSLEEELYNQGIEPLYSFSVRESKEEHLSDGSVKKVNVFKHAGFVRV